MWDPCHVVRTCGGPIPSGFWGKTRKKCTRKLLLSQHLFFSLFLLLMQQLNHFPLWLCQASKKVKQMTLPKWLLFFLSFFDAFSLVFAPRNKQIPWENTTEEWAYLLRRFFGRFHGLCEATRSNLRPDLKSPGSKLSVDTFKTQIGPKLTELQAKT